MSVVVVTTEVERERERQRDHLLCEVCAEAEKELFVTRRVVSVRHQLRPKKQLCVTESVISIVSMKHQLRPKKQLFVTEISLLSL
jgi:hypothetical protein